MRASGAASTRTTGPRTTSGQGATSSADAAQFDPSLVTKLLSNTGPPRDSDSVASFEMDHAQAFTTSVAGSNNPDLIHGFTLTRIEFELTPESANASADFQVHIYSGPQGALGRPADKLGTLTQDAADRNVFRSPTGIQLDKNGFYLAVVDVDSHTNGDSIGLMRTGNLGADPGQDSRFHFGGETTCNRPYDSASWDNSALDGGNNLRMAVYGFYEIDYDTDDDGLIDIKNAAQLNAIRWDLDGNGNVGDRTVDEKNQYKAAFPSRVSHMGCGDTNNDGDPGPCEGYELVADITLSTATGPSGVSDVQTWVPIGHNPVPGQSMSHSYVAELEGNGYVVRNLVVTTGLSGSGHGSGLFAKLGSGAVVSDLGIISPYVTARANAGALAGISEGTVERVAVRGGFVRSTFVLFSDPGHPGGLVGRLRGSGSITDSYSRAAVSLARTDLSQCSALPLGGVAGSVGGSATITNSYSAGKLRACSMSRRGGVAGNVAVSSGANASATASCYDWWLAERNHNDGRGVPKDMSPLKVGGPGSAVFSGWNVPDTVWAFRHGYYPRLDFEGRYDKFLHDDQRTLSLSAGYAGPAAPADLMVRSQRCVNYGSGATVHVELAWDDPAFGVMTTVDGWATSQVTTHHVVHGTDYTTIYGLAPGREHVLQMIVFDASIRHSVPVVMLVNTPQCASTPPAALRATAGVLLAGGVVSHICVAVPGRPHRRPQALQVEPPASPPSRPHSRRNAQGESGRVASAVADRAAPPSPSRRRHLQRALTALWRLSALLPA